MPDLFETLMILYDVVPSGQRAFVEGSDVDGPGALILDCSNDCPYEGKEIRSTAQLLKRLLLASVK